MLGAGARERLLSTAFMLVVGHVHVRACLRRVGLRGSSSPALHVADEQCAPYWVLARGSAAGVEGWGRGGRGHVTFVAGGLHLGRRCVPALDVDETGHQS